MSKDKRSFAEKFTELPKIFRFLLLVICVIIFFTAYEVCIICRIKAIVHIYGILLAIFLLIFGVLNRGFLREKADFSALPEGMSEQEKEAYIAKERKRDSAAKLVLLPILSILLTFAFDLIYMLFT